MYVAIKGWIFIWLTIARLDLCTMPNSKQSVDGLCYRVGENHYTAEEDKYTNGAAGTKYARLQETLDASSHDDVALADRPRSSSGICLYHEARAEVTHF